MPYSFAANRSGVSRNKCKANLESTTDTENRFNQLYASYLSVSFNPKNEEALKKVKQKRPDIEDYLINQHKNLDPQLSENEVLARARITIPPRKAWLPKETRFESLNDPAFLQSQIEDGLQFVYKEYVRVGTVTESETAILKEVDSLLVRERTSYIFFHDEQGRVYFAIRIYDGSLKPFAPLTDGKLLLPTSKKSASLPVELEYPRLKISDRYKVEIGRTARDTLSDDNLHRMFAHVADQLSGTFPEESKLMIYAECTQSRLEWYVQKHGFEVFAGSRIPDEIAVKDHVVTDFQLLPEMKGAEDRYIIRIPMKDFQSINGDMQAPHSLK